VSEDTERVEVPATPPGPPAQRAGRQRRPTGAPPPLPHPITVSTTAWLLLAAVALAGAFLVSELTPWRRADDQVAHIRNTEGLALCGRGAPCPG